MPKTPAEKAIREFPFWNYGMDEVDPKNRYAEWVPVLAASVEAAVRKQVAREIEAECVDPEWPNDGISQNGKRAADIARGGQ